MNYPIVLNFKVFSLARQASLVDNDGNSIAFARQKLLKLKEQLEVFRDKTQSKRVCNIKADRVIDFRAIYTFFTEDNETIGSIKREGMRSFWKATYQLKDGIGAQLATIHEENPFAKVLDSFLGDIPVLGLFCNYLFNPSYLVTNAAGQDVFRITKSPSLWGGLFTIDKLAEVSPEEEIIHLMGLLMMIFMEKQRG